MSLLALDTRWQRFNDESRACPCCGKTFNGIFDIGYDHPDDWPHAPREGSEDVRVGDDRLGTDLCRLGGRHFLRGTLMLPVKLSGESFGFGPWAEVSSDVFSAYLGTYDPKPQPFPDAEGILANVLPGFDAEANVAVIVACPDPTQRPGLTVADGALADAQEQGISFDDLLDIYAAAGMDVRAHLSTS